MSSKISYGARPRGLSETDVGQAADAIFRTGVAPTVRGIRAHLGAGSFNTITPLLNLWWKRIASRLSTGPAALDRVPEPVAHIAEALWLQALEEGRARAEQELAGQSRSAEDDRRRYEVQSHVLSLREGELQSRLDDKTKLIATLERELGEFKTLWRREAATRQALERQIQALRLETSKPPRNVQARRLNPKTSRASKIAKRARTRSKTDIGLPKVRRRTPKTKSPRR